MYYVSMYCVLHCPTRHPTLPQHSLAVEAVPQWVPSLVLSLPHHHHLIKRRSGRKPMPTSRSLCGAVPLWGTVVSTWCVSAAADTVCTTYLLCEHLLACLPLPTPGPCPYCIPHLITDIIYRWLTSFDEGCTHQGSGGGLGPNNTNYYNHGGGVL